MNFCDTLFTLSTQEVSSTSLGLRGPYPSIGKASFLPEQSLETALIPHDKAEVSLKFFLERPK
jgi:hypothetical protein